VDEMSFIRWPVIIFFSLVLTGGVSSRAEIKPDIKSKVTPQDLYCESKNEQAMQFYTGAVVLAEQGHIEKAKDLYLKAIELDSVFCDAMDNLGQLFRSEGNLEKAIHWYKKSLKIFPENPVALQNLAVAYRLQGKTKEAIAEYQLLNKVDPENPEGYYGLGTVYFDLKQYSNAVTQFQKAEKLYSKKSSPLVTDTRYYLGISYFFLEDWAKAKDYFEQIYTEFKDNPDINLLLGACCLYIKPKNRELARKYLGRAEELGMEIPEDMLRELDR
jgi:tetratricopeptide (TPR) repeat protein